MKRQLKLIIPPLLVCIAAGAAVVQAAVSLVLPDQTLRYDVTYNRTPAGAVEINIRNQSDGYVVSSTTHPNMLARLFMERYTNETVFHREGSDLLLRGARERRDGQESISREFTVDRTQWKILLADGEEVPISPEDELESVTFPMMLLHDDFTALEGKKIRQVGTRRVRDFIYRKPVRETIQVAAGEFSCWKITRYRVDRPETTVTVWLDSGDTPIPVKISIFNKGSTTTLELVQG